jgi:hypothetical protein
VEYFNTLLQDTASIFHYRAYHVMVVDILKTFCNLRGKHWILW